MMIQMDMVDSGNTIMACKMLGTVPESHEPDDFNLYVRTIGSTVIVTRSDTDETIVSAVGFNKAMVCLADHYMLPVTVQADFGVPITRKAAELIGTYSPTREDSGFRTLHGTGDVVRVGDVVSVPTLPDFEPVEIVAFLPLRTIVRGVRTGLLSAMERIEYVNGEIVAKHVPTTGVANVWDTVYRDRDGATGVITDITMSGDLMITTNGRDEYQVSVSALVTQGFEVIPATTMEELKNSAKRCNRMHGGHRCDRTRSGGQCPCVTLVKRPAVKHKSTSKSRARRGGTK